MKLNIIMIFTLSVLSAYIPLVNASERMPWGTANVINIKYKPNKVLYDLTSGDKNKISNVLDRVGYLYKLYGSDIFDSSIVVVIHGDAIPFFAIDNFKKYEDIMRRAQSLTSGTSIEFRMCRAAAKKLGYDPGDIHGFVSMVPMADAEIIRLEHEGYAYIQ
jgi:uncharacterized protein